MRIFLLCFCLISPCFAKEFSSYRVYKPLTGGVFNIFDVQVLSLESKAGGALEARLILRRGGEQGGDKTLFCQLEVFERSTAWPKGMEQYVCRDEGSIEGQSPIRHFQFAPGITINTQSKGQLTVWKNEQPKNVVEYKRLSSPQNK